MGHLLTSQDVLAGVFAQTQFGQGYDEREVDAFLDEVVATLRHHEAGSPTASAPVTATQVTQTRFTPTRMRRGYAMDDVDTLLEDVAATLRHHETGAGVAVPTDPPRTSATPAPRIRPKESVGARVLRVLRGDKA